MFEQMAGGGGGLPPEFAAFFGPGGPRRRGGGGGRRGGGDPLFDLLSGGGGGGMSFGGPGVSMSFSSFGGPGGGVRYTSGGGGPRRRGPGAGPEVQQEGYVPDPNPIIDLQNRIHYACSVCCRNCFTFLLLWNMFGGLVPSFIYNGVANLFTSDSALSRYDFSLSATATQTHKQTTATLNIDYFLDQTNKETLDALKEKKPTSMADFESNLDTHVFGET